MISLKYDNLRFIIGLLLPKKRVGSVYLKVSYMIAGILKDKSASSLVIDIFER